MPTLEEEMEIEEQENAAGAESDEDSSDDEEDFIVSGAVSRALQIQQLKTQLRNLEKEHKNHVRDARMLLDAQEHYKGWDSGTPRWGIQADRNPVNVLLALKSAKVPMCMKWSYPYKFYNYKLENNRDVFLARLELDDFESTFVDKAFDVPKRFRKDKEVMMVICSKNSQALQFASKNLQNDQEVVMAAIQRGLHTAPLAIQHASDKIRGMKKIVRVALNQEHGIRCVKYIAPKLQKDKRLILTSIRHSSAECNRLYEVLSDLPESLREDDEIVFAALEKRGSNLRYVACPDLLNDLDVVVTACQQDGGAFAFVPEGPTKELLREPEYLRMIVANGGFAALDDKTAERVFSDKELLMAAAQSSTLHIDNLEQVFKDDSSFCLEILSTNSNLYQSLPDELKQNEAVVRACLGCETLTEEVATKILGSNPKLRGDKEVVMTMATKGFRDAIKKADQTMRDDKTIMMAACTAEGACFKLASDRLQRDPEILSAAMSSSCPYQKAIFRVPQQVYKADHALAVTAIQTYGGDKPKSLRAYLPASVFSDRKVLLAWLEREDFPYETFITPELIQQGNYSKDREVLLAIAKYRNSLSGLGCGEMLRDRAFVKECLAVSGRILDNLHGGRARRRYYWNQPHIRQECPFSRWDFELMLIAVGQSRMTLSPNDYHSGKQFVLLTKFSSTVRERLDATDAFILTFLRGISTFEQHCAPAKRCRLPLLDSGGGDDIKRLVANFADIPVGKEVRLLRAALENLEFWGY